MPPSVTVVFLVFDRRDELRTSLRKTLHESDYDRSRLDVVVVDNASRDGSADMVAAEFGDVRLLRREVNCGVSGFNDGFAVAGRAEPVTDAALRQVVRAQVLTERDGNVWPSFDEDVIFELVIERALLTLTQADGQFPAGPTIWTAADRPGG